MKIKHFIFMLMLGVIGILRVDAASLEIRGASTINSGSTESYEIVLKDSGGSVNTVEFRFNADSGVAFNNIKDGFSGISPNIVTNGKSTISAVKAGEENPKLADGVIGKFTLKNTSTSEANIAVTLVDIKFDGTESTGGPVTKDITLKNVTTTTKAALKTSPYLSNITLSSGTMKPAFDKKTFDYKIYIDNDFIEKLTIKYVCEEEPCVLDKVDCKSGCTSDSKLANKLILSQGKNEATFTFKSEDGKSSKDYNFIIYRGETTDGSNLLSGLEIENFTLNEKFSDAVLDYTAKVDYETEEVNIKATPADENAKVEIKGNKELKVGENVITITVTSAETLEKKIYNITLTREDFEVVQSTTKAAVTTTEEVDNTLLIVIIVVVGLGIIGASAYFIFFRKPKDKNKNDKNKKDVITPDEDMPKMKDEKLESLDVKQNDLADLMDLTDNNDNHQTVEEALDDLMQTKNISLK